MNIYLEKEGMEKNIIMINKYLRVNIYMDKEMEKEKNIIMVN